VCTYLDFTFGWIESFKCDEDSVKDGYCIFHHPEYWKENKDEVREKFMKKVEDAINNNKELFCIGYNLPEINLSGKKFKASVYFVNTVFHEYADFSGAEFSSEVNFSEAKFFSKANFFGAEFSSEAEFYKAKFQVANFSGAEFQVANFSGAEFQRANFSLAKLQVANFSKAEFHQKTSFRETLFEKAVNFNHAILGVPYMEILPSHVANYNAIIDFYGAKFEKPSLAIFDFNNLSLTSFINVDTSRVDFRNIFWFPKDGGYAIHDEEAFKILHKRIREYPFKLMRLFSFILGSDKLIEQASYRLKNLAKYVKEQEKIGREYKWLIEEACKKTIKNKNASDFKRVYLTLSIHNEFIKNNEKLDLELANYVKSKKLELISYFKEDSKFFVPTVEIRSLTYLFLLSQKNLDYFIIRLNKLVDIIRDFNETSERIKAQVKGLIKQASYYIQQSTLKEKENLLNFLKEIEKKLNDVNVVDEMPLEKNMVYEAVMKPLIFARRQLFFLNEELDKEEYSLRNVLTVYRRLRENYEYNVDYETSGEFFIKEMELKRYASKLGIEEKSIWDYLFLTLYKWLANYGESYLRPILAMLITIIIFGLINAISNGLNSLNFKHIWHSLEDSVKTFFQMKELKDITMMQVAERAISPTLLGLLFLALRRKFERRFRH